MVQFGRMNLPKRTGMGSFCFNCGGHATRTVVRGVIVQDCCDSHECEEAVDRQVANLMHLKTQPEAGC